MIDSHQQCAPFQSSSNPRMASTGPRGTWWPVPMPLYVPQTPTSEESVVPVMGHGHG